MTFRIFPETFLSARNKDRSVCDAYQATKQSILELWVTILFEHITRTEFEDILLVVAENSHCGVKLWFRTNMNTIEEAQAVFNKVLNAYVVPLQKQKLVGGVMGFVENPKEICMILPIFHHSDVPREDMLSLSEVESVLEEVGYLKEEN